ERGEADAAFDFARGVLAREARALLAVVGKLERAFEQRAHVNVFAYDLTGGGRLAAPDEVAAAQLFGREADRPCDFVQVSFEGEDALRSAEAAEGSVRRRVRGDGARAYADVRAVVRPGGVDCAAREDDCRQSSVCAAVNDEVYVHADESSVARDGGAVSRA